MKRVFLKILLVLIMLTCMVGCTSNKEENNDKKHNDNKEVDAEEIYQKYLDNKEYENEDFGGLSPIKYTYLDVTEDDIPELFITADDVYENNSHYTLVLTIENDSVKKVGMIHSTTGILYAFYHPTHIAYLQNSVNSNVYVVKIDDNNEFKKLYDVYLTGNQYHLVDYENNIDKDCTVPEASEIMDSYHGWYLNYSNNIDGTLKDSSPNILDAVQIGIYTAKYDTYIGKDDVKDKRLTIKSDGTATLESDSDDSEKKYTYKIEDYDFAKNSSSSNVKKAIVFYNDNEKVSFALYLYKNNSFTDGNNKTFKLNKDALN